LLALKNNYQSAWILKLDNQRNIIWQNLFRANHFPTCFAPIVVKFALVF
jgi:hypothetical protein